MKKAIIVLNGTPDGKSAFSLVLKEIAWVWELNPKKYIKDKAKLFNHDGETDLEKYAGEQLELVNKHFDFEKKYLRENIGRFKADEDEFKTNALKTKSFDKFVLIIHGVSQDIIEHLKEEYGIFTVNISRKDLNTNIEKYDKVLYSDDEGFSIDVNRTIEILTGGTNGG